MELEQLVQRDLVGQRKTEKQDEQLERTQEVFLKDQSGEVLDINAPTDAEGPGCHQPEMMTQRPTDIVVGGTVPLRPRRR